MLANQIEERRKEIVKAISKAAEKYADNTTGKVRFENEAILIVGRKWMNNPVRVRPEYNALIAIACYKWKIKWIDALNSQATGATVQVIE